MDSAETIPAVEADTVMWCAGLAAAGSRQLSPHEERTVAAMRARSLMLAWLPAASIPIVWAAAVLIAVAAPRTLQSSASMTALNVVLLAATCGLGLAALRGFQRAGMLRAYRGCCRFEGHVEDALRDSAQTALLDQGWLEADAAPEQVIETIGCGGPVWTANGRRVTRWITARVVQTAVTPPTAAIGAEWVAPMPGAPMNAPHINRRTLSVAERTELVRHRRRMLLRALPFAVAVNAWTCWVVASSAAEGHLPGGRDAVTFGLLLLCTASTDLQLVRYLRLCGRFARDIASGQVVILRTPKEPEADSGEPGKATELGPPIETLPASRALWTVEGRPAPWRITPLR